LAGGELPPPPQPASARASNNPAAKGRSTVRRLALACLETRRVQATPAKSMASIIRAWGPGKRGWGRVRGAIADGAVVATVTATLLPGVAGFGETAQVDSEGAPVQVKVTAWFNPPSPPTDNVYVAVCPAETVADDEEPEGVVSV